MPDATDVMSSYPAVLSEPGVFAFASAVQAKSAAVIGQGAGAAPAVVDLLERIGVLAR